MISLRDVSQVKPIVDEKPTDGLPKSVSTSVGSLTIKSKARKFEKVIGVVAAEI
jgi:hypothetical protein